MILMHREQRGAAVKPWLGVLRFKRECESWHGTASERVASCRVEDSRLGEPGRVKAQNIEHRSDLASLCISNQKLGDVASPDDTFTPTAC